MKKVLLVLILNLFIVTMMGCDFFGTPYDKMMNAFEAEIIGQNAIDISVVTTMDYVIDTYDLEATRTTVSMTYFIEEEAVSVTTSVVGQSIELYIDQSNDGLIAYMPDGNKLYPIDMTDVEEFVPIDTTIFDIEDYTGKAQWESEFEETEEGVFETEISLETLFDDDMFKDIEESFTSVGATVESLIDKVAKITVSYDASLKELSMIFDLESFEVTTLDSTDRKSTRLNSSH